MMLRLSGHDLTLGSAEAGVPAATTLGLKDPRSTARISSKVDLAARVSLYRPILNQRDSN